MTTRRASTGEHTPVRTCVACRRRRSQAELVRLAATREGVAVDRERRSPGRGAYVCPEADCIDAAGQRGGRVLRRALRAGDESQIVEALAAVRSAEMPEERTA